MRSLKVHEIGNNNPSEYLDSSEEELLKIYSSKDPEEKVKKILSDNPPWPLLYHLSPARENLLNWYTFPPEASLLEVGAGCGALTGLFCRRLKKVTALELTKKRAKIIALRYKEANNLEVIAGNIENFKIGEKFDFVTSIGVLEYAGLYLKGEDPQKEFLLKLKTLLKPGGTLILAIENRLGLKYWSGCLEDHTSLGFESIHGYPTATGIKTFSRLELKNLLREAGFSKQEFYYPVPDYKLPVEIYSSRFLPGEKKLFALGLFPSPVRGSQREFLFSEHLAMYSLAKNELFEDFSNSFLVCAKER
ncbi:MAG: hypothetical protein A2126_01700 [Candidatus Woykebacteria bacterium GWB1_45_5]|uniref:Methyltransferase type 11 domain-containing protein n=2 Tax=Candidatus Woykeibacteriota TaxID=1817899 RepID=A0A1G1W1Z2_9BACT|nr:MAG: hypothetical protein A2113_04030 [Candidatus Woykebacteria bacterium GWA1_44_8]OGY23013.1 MAG: hypothetical protein A2126_01700 [Candidatus Woykebacteria bacterium GWB1_45_5]